MVEATKGPSRIAALFRSPHWFIKPRRRRRATRKNALTDQKTIDLCKSFPKKVLS